MSTKTKNNKIVLDFSDPTLYVDYVNEYVQALYDPKIRYIFLQGGAGAGKSQLATQITIQQVISGMQYLWTRKIRATIPSTCYKTLEEQTDSWNLSDMLVYQKSLKANTTIKNNKGEILFLGLDNSAKVKSLFAPHNIVMEEATDFTYDDFCQLDIRLRGKPNQKLILIFNPIDENHWLKINIKDNVEWDWEKSVWLEKTIFDNRFADPSNIQALKNLEKVNPELAKIYLRNEWGKAKKGLVFEKFTIGSYDFEPDCGGLDFGYTDPCCLVYTKVFDIAGQKKKVAFKQVLFKTGLTPEQLVEEFAILNVPKTLVIYADSQKPEMIKTLQVAGYNVYPCKKGAGSIYAGIMNMLEYDIELVDCVEIVKEFQNYCWQENKGTILDQNPKKGFDHGIDAARYSIQYYGRTVRKAMNLRAVVKE